MAIYTAAELAEVTALGTSEAQVFSNSNKCIIKQMLLANYTATDRTVEIKVIPTGDTTGDQHIIFGDTTVQANTTTVIDLAMVIPANASVAAKCSAANCLARQTPKFPFLICSENPYFSQIASYLLNRSSFVLLFIRIFFV